MATLAGAVEEVQTAIRTYVPGVQQVPETIADNAAAWPFVIAYPASGNSSWRSQTHRIENFTLIVELHITAMQEETAVNMQEAMSYHETVPAAIKTAEIAGELSNVDSLGNMDWTFGAMDIGGVDTIGFRWNINNVIIHQVG